VPRDLDAQIAMHSLNLSSSRAVTRADLADAVHRRVGLSHLESAEIVDAVLTEIIEVLASGENLKLSSFGFFHVLSKKERLGRNPKTGIAATVSSQGRGSSQSSSFITAAALVHELIEARDEERLLRLRHRPNEAAEAAAAIRGHWGIENRSHYVRDVTLCEDASRIRKNPGVFARIRSFAYNILRINQTDSIAQDRYAAALGGLDFLLSLKFNRER
jgi:integration host factor subunit alpha